MNLRADVASVIRAVYLIRKVSPKCILAIRHSFLSLAENYAFLNALRAR